MCASTPKPNGARMVRLVFGKLQQIETHLAQSTEEAKQKRKNVGATFACHGRLTLHIHHKQTGKEGARGDSRPYARRSQLPIEHR